jgi:cyclic pyranopterin phosphate synthase
MRRNYWLSLTSADGFGQNERMTSELDNQAGSGAEGIRDTLGRPIQDLRISLLDQCNFRCPYCMPEAKYHADYQFLKRRERLSHAEILRLARIAVDLGVSKLRLTGGEPLLDKNIVELISSLSGISGLDDFALTTNGMLLASVAKDLAAAGLHRVTISLDSLDDAIFSSMSGGRGDMQTILEGIDAAEAAGLSPIKINVVVQKGVNDHTVLPLLEHFRGSGHVVRLIEFMDVGNRNGWTMDQVVPSRDLLQQIQSRWPVRAVGRSYPGEVASRYSYLDGQGEIGFISSVTEAFCGACSRARLSADGVLYTCLFATTGTDLREPIRNGAGDDAIADIISDVWLRRADRYSEVRQPDRAETFPLRKVEMYRMGG